ncbi:MAG: hypothetical protein IE933_13825 [Sphingomonadales bacterium]|nr:hypothetical protein [Sphingomonadales bacterium]MBD3773838.1 hypothetical protein [Paracoccaceae bacterium]
MAVTGRAIMRRFARWHIWLAWLAGVPVLMWTLSGLVMVTKPIEEVRGNHLRVASDPLPLSVPVAGLEGDAGIKEMRAFMQRGRAVMLLTRMDDTQQRIDLASNTALPPLDALGARQVAAETIVGGDRVASVTLFPADRPAPDFRRPVATWQVALEDGTHVYIGRDSGEVEAVRTRWWRFYDTMWGLHIMDLQTREDSHHPALVIFAALALAGALLGVVLMFRRRKYFLRRVL